MELNYKEFGQGDPLIILHGLFGTLDNWQTLAKKFAKDYTVFIVDQRNHGRSPHIDHIDYPSMANDLQHFMESNWIYKAHILGHSMGGKTAMEFALNYSDMVDKLIVVDIAPKKYAPRHQTIFDALFSVKLEEVNNRKEAEAILTPQIESYGVRQFLLKNLSRNKAGGYEWKMNLPIIYKHYQDILDDVNTENIFEGPSLFIDGADSEHIQDADHSLIKSRFPNAQIETIVNAGHWVHADQPMALLNTVSSFLKSTN